MDKWEMVRLGDVFSQAITGEWGTDCTENSSVNVLRTTNFTNNGSIDYSNVIRRSVEEKKIRAKQLKCGDIILEKSGGSDNQPVGRVVYFSNTDGVYLCNNFTQTLRTNDEVAKDKYVFYFMFWQHQIGKTELLQNRTTGIRNLQVKNYMTIQIPLPPLPIQKKIVDLIDRASALIEKRKAQIEKLDLLVKSLFAEMFGDPTTNPMRWESVYLGSTIAVLEAGWSVNGEQRQRLTYEDVVLKVSAVTSGVFKPEEYKVIAKNIAIRKRVFPQRGDLLFSRANTRELVGATCLIFRDYPDLLLPDKLWRIRFNQKVECSYMKHILSHRAIRSELSNTSTGTSGSMYNISMDKLRKTIIPIPPLTLQAQFATLVERVEAQKAQLQRSLNLLELNYKSLIQKCFRGEVF